MKSQPQFLKIYIVEGLNAKWELYIERLIRQQNAVWNSTGIMSMYTGCV